MKQGASSVGRCLVLCHRQMPPSSPAIALSVLSHNVTGSYPFCLTGLEAPGSVLFSVGSSVPRSCLRWPWRHCGDSVRRFRRTAVVCAIWERMYPTVLGGPSWVVAIVLIMSRLSQRDGVAGGRAKGVHCYACCPCVCLDHYCVNGVCCQKRVLWPLLILRS